MADLENNVRAAATALHDAIVAAQAAGYRVPFPRTLDELNRIAISETAAVKPAAPAERLKTFGAKPQGVNTNPLR